jgi:hypothetical protein
MARRPVSREAEIKELERKLAFRALLRQEHRREAAARRRKEQRQIATGTASIDTVRRFLGPHFWDR